MVMCQPDRVSCSEHIRAGWKIDGFYHLQYFLTVEIVNYIFVVGPQFC